MYSLMSKRWNGTSRERASCLASSVLPTPVGPTNRKLPVGRSLPPRPARPRLMARDTEATASSWPYTTPWRSCSRCSRRLRSAPEARRVGMPAMRATSCSTSRSLTLRRPFGPGRSFTAAPDLVHHVDRLVGQEAVVQVPRGELHRRAQGRAARSARRGAPRSGAPGRRGSATASSSLGSFTSMRWKRRASARSRSKWRYSW